MRWILQLPADGWARTDGSFGHYSSTCRFKTKLKSRCNCFSPHWNQWWLVSSSVLAMANEEAWVWPPSQTKQWHLGYSTIKDTEHWSAWAMVRRFFKFYGGCHGHLFSLLHVLWVRGIKQLSGKQQWTNYWRSWPQYPAVLAEGEADPPPAVSAPSNASVWSTVPASSTAAPSAPASAEPPAGTGTKRKLPQPVPWRRAMKEEQEAQERASQSAQAATAESAEGATTEGAIAERDWYANVQAKTDPKHRSGSLKKLATLAVQYTRQNWPRPECKAHWAATWLKKAWFWLWDCGI